MILVLARINQRDCLSIMTIMVGKVMNYKI